MSPNREQFSAFLAQVLASSISVILTIAAALALSPSQLGLLAVCMAVQALSLGAARAFATEPVLFSHGSYTGGFGALLDPSTTASVAIGSLLGLVSVVVGAAVGEFGLGFALAACVLTTIVQDHFRTLLFVKKQGGRALVTDGMGIIVLLACVAWASSDGQPGSFLFAWAASGLAASLTGWLLLKPRLRPRSLRLWRLEQARSGGLYLTDFLVTSGLSLLAVIAVAVIVGPVGAAALRGAQVLLTPVALVLRVGIALVAPAIVSLSARGDIRRAYLLGGYFSMASGVSALLCIVWLFVPIEWVRFILGESTELALGTVVASALAWGATGIAIGPGLCLRATGRLELATRIKLWLAPISAGALIAGATLAGAPGSQVGLALGEALRAGWAWSALRRGAN